MFLEELRAKVREWDLKGATDPETAAYYATILDQLDYHAVREWRTYLPADGANSNPHYMDRLAAWIGNVTAESDQKLLLEYARYICFFSHDDFAALYRSAFGREITRWVAESAGLTLQMTGLQAFQSAVHNEIHNHTWYCPVTDSMDINEFYKVNHLSGIGHRPAFAILELLADKLPTPDAALASNLRCYMSDPGIGSGRPRHELKRLVLLEDIVGSGSQCLNAVRWAVNNLNKPVLFVPLILCPTGAQAIRDEVRNLHPWLTVAPVVELGRGDLLGPERQGATGWPVTAALELLADRCAPRASQGMETYGFRQTGCSIATFANTPDNTLPIVHNRPANGAWSPLFPRVYRD